MLVASFTRELTDSKNKGRRGLREGDTAEGAGTQGAGDRVPACKVYSRARRTDPSGRALLQRYSIEATCRFGRASGEHGWMVDGGWRRGGGGHASPLGDVQDERGARLCDGTSVSPRGVRCDFRPAWRSVSYCPAAQVAESPVAESQDGCDAMSFG